MSVPSAVEFIVSDSVPAPSSLCTVSITDLQLGRAGAASARFFAAIPSVLGELTAADGLLAHGIRVRATRLQFTTYAAFVESRHLSSYLASGAHGEISRALRGRLGTLSSVRLQMPAGELPGSWAQIDALSPRGSGELPGAPAPPASAAAGAPADGEPAVESVWDYPRPPRVEQTRERVTVSLAGEPIAATTRALRVLKTSHPPTYYIPFADIEMAALTASSATSWCEFKGRAHYWDATAQRSVGWSYPLPSRGYETLRDHLAFYPGRVQARVGDEPVIGQPGDFYGGWITSGIRGPFKGGLGTSDW